MINCLDWATWHFIFERNSEYSTLVKPSWKCGKEASMGWNSCYFKFIRPTFFKVPPRSVRDRYSLLLVKKYKSKRRAEDKASGRAPNHTEIDEALLDMIERFDEADIARQKAKAEKKVEEKLVQIQNMRNASLETCGDTRKRKENGEGSLRQIFLEFLCFKWTFTFQSTYIRAYSQELSCLEFIV